MANKKSPPKSKPPTSAPKKSSGNKKLDKAFKKALSPGKKKPPKA